MEMNATDPMVAIRHYIDAFSMGDIEAMASVFSVSGSILDGMAPHLWVGPTAPRDWYADVLAEGEHHGASGYCLTLGEPVQNNVTGDSAYVVAPGSLAFQVKGRPVPGTPGIFTVAL